MTDVLVLKHQDISSHSTDYVFIIWLVFCRNIAAHVAKSGPCRLMPVSFFQLFVMSIITTDDIISSWTCVLCKVPPNEEYSNELHSQFIENGECVVIGPDYIVFKRCSCCGSVYHVNCLHITPRDILIDLYEYTCPACVLWQVTLFWQISFNNTELK